jgi:hypothetical protein
LLAESVDDAHGFNEFWDKWKRRVAKADAQRAWRKLKPNAELRAKILKDIERFESSELQFIPHAATYLNGKRWEDEPTPMARAGPTARGQPDIFDRIRAVGERMKARDANEQG